MSKKRRKSGVCYIIGAGPGDPGLLTLKARTCLEKADVIFYDYLCNPEILRFAAPQAQCIFVGKSAGKKCIQQSEINHYLIQETVAGKNVCRLKGGDPCVFGRGGEEASVLADAGLPFEIVPGVSSCTAVPAYAGIPVTHRGITPMFTVITGHEDPSKASRGIDWKQVAGIPGTKVILMGVGRLVEISKELINGGMSDKSPVAVICWGTYKKQKTVTGTLKNIVNKSKQFKPPGVIVIGDVVKLRAKLSWFKANSNLL